MQKPRMLTADELEALRRRAKERAAYLRAALGSAQSAAAIEAERRGDEWWAKRLSEMREDERRGG